MRRSNGGAATVSGIRRRTSRKTQTDASHATALGGASAATQHHHEYGPPLAEPTIMAMMRRMRDCDDELYDCGGTPEQTRALDTAATLLSDTMQMLERAHRLRVGNCDPTKLNVALGVLLLPGRDDPA